MTAVPLRGRFDSVWWAAGLLVVVTAVVYLPALHGGFIWDDNVYVYSNPQVTAPDGLHDIWLTADSIEYYPLFYSTLWAEWHLWGMNPAGFHAVNILLHMLNVLLLWRLLKSLEVPGALLGALLFAVHPVNVETVAWISELKNTLSLFFFLLACLAWVRFRRGPPRQWGFYALTLGLFLLALLSKTTVVVFPVLMLGVAWWKGGRITGRDLWQSAPFFLLALVMGLLLIWFLPHRFPSDEAIRQTGILARLAGAGLATWFYLGKVVYPHDLSLVYRHWSLDTGRIPALVPLALVPGIFGLLWSRRSSWGRAPLLGLGFFWVALLPSLGLIVHPYLKQSPVADRWLYLPLIGLAALAGAGWSRWYAAGGKRGGNLAVGAAAAVVIALGIAAHGRSVLFADAESLYRDTLVRNPDATLIRNNLALVLMNKGRRNEAIRELKRVTTDDPSSSEAWNNLGSLVLGAGHPAEAIPCLEKALEIRPDMIQVKLNLGLALAEVGRVPEAVPMLQAAARGSGDNPLINRRLAEILAGAGRHQEAAAAWRKVLEREPDDLRAAYRLAGEMAAAGDRPGAIGVYRQIVTRHPSEFGAQVNLGNLLARQGRAAEAVTAFRTALRLDSSQPGVLNNLAWLLATHPDPAVRNGPEALELARRAVDLSGAGNPRVFETLAAAEAAVGRFPEAVSNQRRAMAAAGAPAEGPQRQVMEDRLDLYRQGRPYVEPVSGTEGPQ